VPPIPLHLVHLRDRVREGAENRPGVYRMLGDGGELLYVGKSVRVRSRLLSYFRASPGEKAGELLEETRRITWEYVPHEFPALLLEMRLIQEGQPRFNVEHRRKRRVGFVKITREPAPRLLLVGRVVEDGSAYYGPFPALKRVGNTLRELVQHLGIRDCAASTPLFFDDQLELLSGAPREPRCIRAELATCLSPCAGACGAREYGSRVGAARRFLEGRGGDTLGELRERMWAAAGRGEYEYAALLRDRLERLDRLRADLTAFQGRVDALTFLYRVPAWGGGSHLHLIRRGRVLAQFASPRGRRVARANASRVRELMAEPDRGPGALTPHQAAEILLVARWFRLRPEERRRTVAPEVWLEEQAATRAPGAIRRRPSSGSGPTPSSGRSGRRAGPGSPAPSPPTPSPPSPPVG